MGWNARFLLHLFCAVAAVARVHSQRNSTQADLIVDQAFEGDAVHSIMQSWLDAGTSPAIFNIVWQWYMEEHPCYVNTTHTNRVADWTGIYCATRFFQPQGSEVLVQYHSLVELSLYVDEDVDVGLVGGLPPAIVNLTNLDYIFIANASHLSGPLPQRLFCFSEVLQTMILFNCSFNGSISNGFDLNCDGNEGLEYLDLSMNSFTDIRPISETDYPPNFQNLQYLNVSNNQMTGEFSIWAYSLEIIDISNNFITNITDLGGTAHLSNSLKSIYAQNNSISRFPSEIFQYRNLEDIYFDLNDISSIEHNFSNIPVSSIRRISMSQNMLKIFPTELLQLPNLEEIILDSNIIGGALYLPNISCQNSKIKLISLLYNDITHFYPSSVNTSCFSESSILQDAKIFLYGNPFCDNSSNKSRLLRFVCRTSATSRIEAEYFYSEPNEKSNRTLFTVIGCVSFIALDLFVIGFFVTRKLMKKIALLREIQSEFDKRDVKPNLYSYSELKIATQDFHTKNELGRGGFGIVYKGILRDGSCVAVKKLTKSSNEQGIQDFLNEIITVSNIKHRNLVQLKGCCIKENQRILVHEFIENNNLEYALWGNSRSGGHLDWPSRFNIILGIARGLAYLHEDVQPAIIHRDIKGENILLDKHFNPKIADFGLALFFPSFDDGETHMIVSTIAGTRGYMAPEYLCHGQISTKLDVFSFGVLLLEIVSGRKKIDQKLPLKEQYLVQWAQELYLNNNLPNLKDKSLGGMTTMEEDMFNQVVKVGLQCLHHIASRRPIMSEVVAMLIGNKVVDDSALEDYHDGSSSLQYISESSTSYFSMQRSSLQSIAKDDNNLLLDLESHKESLQLSEIQLLSK